MGSIIACLACSLCSSACSLCSGTCSCLSKCRCCKVICKMFHNTLCKDCCKHCGYCENCCYCFRNNCKKGCCKNIPKKRLFLPLIGLIFLVVAYKEFRHIIYLPLCVSFVFFILFWNFPFILYYTASRPLYYEDLFIDEKKLPNYDVDESIKDKFKNIFIWILIFTNTSLVAGLSDYWLYKTSGQYTYLEIIGITGGIIKIFQIVNNTFARIMLKILKYYVRKETNKFEMEGGARIKNMLRLKKIASDTALKNLEMTFIDPSKNTIQKTFKNEKNLKIKLLE